MWKRLIVLVLIGWVTYSWWGARPVSYASGVAASDEPEQSAVYNAVAFEHKGYRITPLAQFTAEARVLSREDYRMGRESDLVSTDFVLGWGRMSDKTVLEKVDISQSGRFYYWQVKEFPIPRRELETSSANMHLIPSSDAIESKLETVRVGQLVRFKGHLVRVDAADGWHWVSSLTREDTGGGACELVWIEEISSI